MENFLKNALKWEYLVLACIVAVVGVISIIGLPVPPGRDQGIFLYNGWGWFNDLVPYRDMWDHKPPGIYLLYGLAIQIFGHRYVSINLLAIIWRLGTVVAVYFLASRVYDKREGFIAAAAYGIWDAFVCSGYWWTAQAESFMVLPLVFMVYFYIEDRMSRNALCGIAAMAAILLKTTALLMVGAMVTLILLTPRDTWEPFPKRSKLLGFIYGILMLLVPMLLYFALTFAMDDLWDTVIVFNIYHSGVSFPLSNFVGNFRFLFSIFVPFWVVVWAVAIIDEDEREHYPGLMTVWLAVSVLMVLVQRKFFLYHFFMIIGPAAVLASRGVGIVIDFCKGRANIALRVAAGIVAAAWIAGVGFASIAYVWKGTVVHYRTMEFITGEITKGEYFGRFIDPKGDINLVEDRAVAAYVRDRTKPDETLLVWGFEPLINFWAVRKAPNRFNSDYPLTFEPDSDATRRLREKWRALFMHEMKENPPAYLVVTHNDVDALEKKDSAAQLKEFPEFESLVRKRYELETTIGDFDIHHLK